MYSSIEHLARSLWIGRFEWTNRMAMYSAYFDESGHPDDPSHLIIAGCVADVDQWVHFEREWKAELAPWKTELFHATEFEQRDPPFDHVTEAEGYALIDRLVGIILRRVELPIVVILPLDQHRAMNKKYLLSESYGFPWPAAARSCFHEVIAWARRHDVPEREIEHLFEDGAKHKGQLLWISERDHLRTPVFKKKHEAIPLQAGDLIAWLCNRSLTQQKAMPYGLLKSLGKLNESTKSVRLNLGDQDGVTKLFGIAVRDPKYFYKCAIVKRNGERVALLHYWPKTKGKEPPLDKKTMVLVDPADFSREAERSTAIACEIIKS